MPTVLHNAPVPHFSFGTFLQVVAERLLPLVLETQPLRALSHLEGTRIGKGPSQAGFPRLCSHFSAWQPRIQVLIGNSHPGNLPAAIIHRAVFLLLPIFSMAAYSGPRAAECPYITSLPSFCGNHIGLHTAYPPAPLKRGSSLILTGCRALILCVASRPPSSGVHISRCVPALYGLSHTHTVPRARIDC